MRLGITTFASEKISTRGAPVEASNVWSYGGGDLWVTAYGNASMVLHRI